MASMDGTLHSDDLFASLAGSGDVAALSLLWRADVPELAVRLAAHLAAANKPTLGDLLLDELAVPVMNTPTVRVAVLSAIAVHRAPLTDIGIERLAEGLRAPEPSVLVPDAPTRQALETWLFGQPGALPNEYALFVIANEPTLAPAPSTLAAAIGRCVDDASLRARAAAAYAERLATSRDAAAWTRATSFIETCCSPQSKEPEVVGLVRRLIELAPTLAIGATFNTILADLIRAHGHATILALLGTDLLPPSPGTFALLAVADTFSRVDDRLDVFVTAYSRHPALFPALEAEAGEWHEARWRQVLSHIRKSDHTNLPERLSPLLVKAPSSQSALLVQIAAAHDWSAGDPELAQIISMRVSEAQASARAAGDSVARILPWPKRVTDSHAGYLQSLIATIGVENDRLDLIVGGLAARAITPAVAAFLLPVGLTKALIGRLRDDAFEASAYRNCLEALLADRNEELVRAAADLQPASFDLVLADILAPVAPDTAFAGADAAFAVMTPVDRDSLLALLETFAGTSQLGVVELFARATERADRTRRARAFGIVARLLHEGSQVPYYLSDGMRVAISEVSRAAFEALARIKPGDPEFLRVLRDMAETDGAIARSAASTLETMTSAFIADLDRAGDLGERRALLTRLGAASRPAAVEVLLSYLGDAPFDDLEIHRAAAAAVREAVPKIKVTSAQLERLGDLLDGDAQENDPTVRSDLGEASMAASLGVDQAINLLFELIHFRPTNTPDELFGPEKGILIRQLGLYKKEADRGAAGRAVAIAHLDNVAERVVRAAYLRLGTSESIKERIKANSREPEYGQILGALSGPLERAKPRLQVLHGTRSERTEIPHPGTPITSTAYDEALEAFRQAGNACVAALDEAITTQP